MWYPKIILACHLRSENMELTAAYNDLNEDFENHKAEHGSVVTSNRDLTTRIGSFLILLQKFC